MSGCKSVDWLDSEGPLFCVVSSFRSPESVEMDEIMAAMVLTSLSCSPVVQSPPQADPGPGLSHLLFRIVVKRRWHWTKLIIWIIFENKLKKKLNRVM